MPLPRARYRQAAFIAMFAVAAALAIPAPGKAALFGSDDERPNYESARALFDSGDHRGAVADLKKFLKAEPAHGAARLLLGRALVRSGLGPSAEEQLRRAGRLGADSDQLAVALARSYLLQRKFTELLAEADPSGRPAQFKATLAYLRGLAHYGLGRLDEADQSFATALASDPGRIGAVLARVRVRIAQVKLDEAESHLAAVAKRAANSPDFRYLSGEIARLRGDTAGAVAAYGETLAIAPNHVPARLARAALLIRTDRMREAAAELASVQRLAPADPQARLLKAILLAKMGNVPEARSVIERLVSTLDHRSPARREDGTPRVLLTGIVHYVRSALDDALEALHRYLAAAPSHVESRILISRILGERRAYDAAISNLRPALSPESGGADVAALLGKLYLHAGRLEEARSAFAQGLERAPGSRTLARQLALIRLAARRSAAEGEDFADLFGAIGPVRGGILAGLLRLGDRADDGALGAARAVAALAPGSAFAQNLAGIARARQGDRGKAREHFRQARALESDYIPAISNLAAAEIADGDWAGARTQYRELLTLAPHDRAAMIELSGLAQRSGDWNTAIDWLVRAVELRKNDVSTVLALNDLYLRAGRYGDALNLAIPLDRNGRRDKRLIEAQARAHIATGDIDGATRLYRDVSGAETSNAVELNRIARIQRRLGDTKGAIFTFKTAMALDVGNRDARDGALELEAPSGGTDRGLIYAKALRLRYPDSGIGPVVAGNAWSRANRHDKAAAAYAEALRLEPTSETALRRFRALERGRNPERARRFLQAWIRQYPKDRAARRELAFASIRAGRWDSAKRQFEAILPAAKRDGVVLNNLAWLAAKLGQASSLSYARQALALRPNDPRVLDTYAMLLVDRGEPAQGLELFRRAQTISVPDARLHYHAALALHRLGRRADALSEVETALRTDGSFPEVDEARRLLRLLGGA